MLAVDLMKVLDALIAPTIIAVGGLIAKFLRDISSELCGVKAAISIATDRVDRHEKMLTIHDERIRAIETER